MNYLKKHWNGKYPLRISFWINGLLLYFLWGLVFSLIIQFSGAQHNGELLVRIFMNYRISTLFISVWQTVGIYRSAQHYQEETGNLILSKLAKNFSLVFILDGLVGTYVVFFKQEALLSVWNDPSVFSL